MGAASGDGRVEGGRSWGIYPTPCSFPTRLLWAGLQTTAPARWFFPYAPLSQFGTPFLPLLLQVRTSDSSLLRLALDTVPPHVSFSKPCHLVLLLIKLPSLSEPDLDYQTLTALGGFRNGRNEKNTFPAL